MNIEVFVVGAFEENTYLLSDASGEAVFVDPGDEGDALADELRARELTLKAIWLTHAHIDHIGGIAGLKRSFDVPVFMHPDDTPVYARGSDVARMYGLPFEEAPHPERALAEGDEVRVGSLRFSVMHVPGHAPGHVAFVGHGVAFSGDCLFAGSIGRSDLPLSDPVQLEASLERLAGLPPETRVLPGHGPETTIGRERATNPFLNGLARPLSR
ncbi:MAG TPA: MBL fold metallo-hydrolase [Gemmatimonadaceae bacterium]|nr:MBL fold metallo-hydrolase [Gemmatimonadaceae bacterium]